MVGYAYICGDAKHMAREVEHALEDILGKAKGGGKEEGAKELKLLKDRNRLLLDVSLSLSAGVGLVLMMRL
jgi:NADPH-ferrihemoprotein reductase